KGNKARKVVLFDDVRALLEQHHEDMAARDTAFEPETPGVRALHGELGALAHARPAAAHRPLIGALRRPPGRWQRDQRGVASLAPGRLADRFGALDPSALYQSLKRFLAACARDAARRGEHDHAEDLRRASTHWLRHFFANSAVADGVEVSTLRDAMGHASLTTTSVYLHTESQRMVREMAKMRRR
ncbi:MAG TPA: site-specific integrase, partial [Rubrivivax sp.]|nr:site-specific integrase [Rubrivivax sp.]